MKAITIRLIIFVFALSLCLIFTCSPYVSAADVTPRIASNVENTIINLLRNAPDIAIGQSLECPPYVFTIMDRRDGRIIVTYSELHDDVATESVYGVIDASSETVILPFQYKRIFFIPDGKLFVILQTDEGDNLYYSADQAGELTRLPLNGEVIGVDEAGYVTLVTYMDVEVTDCEQAQESKTASVPRMALLDDSYHIVLDYVVDAVWPTPIVFTDDLAIVQTGAAEWYRYSQYVDHNGKYGVIDRSGRWIIPPIYTSLQYMGDGSFDAWIETEEVRLNTDSFQPKPSAWASSDVNAAISKELVPASLQYDYAQPITRAEFCALAVSLYETVSGTKVEERRAFLDTCLISVEKAAAAGIVNGVGEGLFAPNASLTREQAAVILARLTSTFIQTPTGYAPKPDFQDSDTISAWALQAVAQIQTLGIMNGIGNNTFSPKEAYTKEQSIVTILRLFELVTHGES